VTAFDWTVLVGTLLAIVAYGTWKTRGIQTVDSYLRGGRDTRWWTIGFSIMATQASAVTFLSAPGQAFDDGMRFVQFYFGLPIAMVLLAAFVLPIYYRLKVYTAYEYLETRFDLKTRQLTAFLFLVQRGLAAGFSIYAPAIILSTVLGWPLHGTSAAIGALVVLYTVSGGTRAVNQTQTLQMIVILSGMALAFAFVLRQLPPEVSFGDAVAVAGSLGKMNLVDFSPRFDTRYTVWSGLTGGLFVALAYFGTDQSQVQRYLSGSTLTEGRLGLLFNGLVKIPMQAMILFVGVIVFVFFQFHAPPVFFNAAELAKVRATSSAPQLAALESSYAAAFAKKRAGLDALLAARKSSDETALGAARASLQAAEAEGQAIRKDVKALIAKSHPRAETQDADYVFISYVTRHLPSGLVGLLLAVILCAAMSSTASALNALGSTTVVDYYRRSWRPGASDAHYLLAAKGFTVFWGVVAVIFASFASLFDNLIQAVNILGSIFYGPTLGVFFIGFFVKRVRATPVFIALLISQALVIAVYAFWNIGFLWLNPIGWFSVVALALLFNGRRSPSLALR
jgi:SSS family solute:Na+ symporter